MLSFVFFPVFYLETLSVSRLRGVECQGYRQMTMNCEGSFCLLIEVLSRNYHPGLSIPKRYLRISGVPSWIPTEHLPNTSLHTYLYIILFGFLIVTPYFLAGRYRRFGGTSCLCPQDLLRRQHVHRRPRYSSIKLQGTTTQNRTI
jgi:hypothetical protein